jgi:hypothetical protein
MMAMATTIMTITMDIMATTGMKISDAREASLTPIECISSCKSASATRVPGASPQYRISTGAMPQAPATCKLEMH